MNLTLSQSSRARETSREPMPVHWRDNLDKYIEALAYNPEAHAYDNVRYTSSAQFKRLETNGTTVTLRYPKKCNQPPLPATTE